MADIDEIAAFEEDVVPTVVLTTVAFLGVLVTLPVLLLGGYLMGKRPARMSRRVQPIEYHHQNNVELVTEKDESTQISLEEGDDIMKDLAPGEVLFTVRPVSDPMKPHEGFHLEDQPDTMKYESPEDMKDKGMQTDPRKKKKKSEMKQDVIVAPRRAASNIEIFTPNHNTVNPFKPMFISSETAIVRKRYHRDHFYDKDKIVQVPEYEERILPPTIQQQVQPPIPQPPEPLPPPPDKTGKHLTSTKPQLDTTTAAAAPTNNNAEQSEECEVCPGFNPTVNWGDMTWLQLFQYMQADGGWYSCRGQQSDRSSGSGGAGPPLRELYKSRANVGGSVLLEKSPEVEIAGAPTIQEASLSKKHHHHPHHSKKSKKTKDKKSKKDKSKKDKDKS